MPDAGPGLFDHSLSVESISASRGGFALFRNISFTLEPGGALRITGPNGSGKTTLLRCLAGLLQLDSGRITALSGNQMHYLGHLNAMKPQLIVAENLRFWAGFHGEHDFGPGFASAVETLRLTRLLELPFSVLSSGQKRRVAIARLLLTPRPLWLLDEPTVGLDAASIAIFENVLEAHLVKGGIVIAATHTPLGTKGWQTLDLQQAASR